MLNKLALASVFFMLFAAEAQADVTDSRDPLSNNAIGQPGAHAPVNTTDPSDGAASPMASNDRPASAATQPLPKHHLKKPHRQATGNSGGTGDPDATKQPAQ